MPSHTNVNRPVAPTPDPAARPVEDIALLDRAPLAEELLVEEVSIDGMCGVY